MKPIPTIKEWLEKRTDDKFYPGPFSKRDEFIDGVSVDDIAEIIKLHVTAALEAVINSGNNGKGPQPSGRIITHKDSILNAYPLTNIK